MSNIKVDSFPKVWALGHRNIRDITEHEMEITEKIDGSQFIFGKLEDGTLILNSKGSVIDEGNPDNLFKPAVDYILSIQDSIDDGMIYYGETLCRPRHNTLKYDNVPKNHIALFGAHNLALNVFYKYDDLVTDAAFLEVDVAPLLFKGVCTPKEVMEFIGKESYLGGAEIEGVVCKVHQGYECHGKLFPVKAAKYVSGNFKEKHSKNPEYQSGKSKLEELFEQYNTSARFHKAVQHLRDNGDLEGDPRDIGKLMKEFNKDIEEECEDEIKDELYKIYRKSFIKTASKGLPEWYKQKLAMGEI